MDQNLFPQHPFSLSSFKKSFNIKDLLLLSIPGDWLNCWQCSYYPQNVLEHSSNLLYDLRRFSSIILRLFCRGIGRLYLYKVLLADIYKQMLATDTSLPKQSKNVPPRTTPKSNLKKPDISNYPKSPGLAEQSPSQYCMYCASKSSPNYCKNLSRGRGSCGADVLA